MADVQYRMDKNGGETAARDSAPKQRMAILDAVQGLANCPTNAANVKALKRRRAGYRLRVGRYRVLFDLDDGVRIITVQEVKKRDERTYQN
ncbi:hypothetical protein ASALC70_03902 [Alcanivorax sp. ALC70]|nr:hypothetical protein ASALC70_03902 [Alcanivorax sp. ALC70]